MADKESRSGAPKSPPRRELRPREAKARYKGPLDRAYELAGSGDHESVWDIKKALRAEGYSADQVADVAGSRVYAELTELMAKARGAAVPSRTEQRPPGKSEQQVAKKDRARAHKDGA